MRVIGYIQVSTQNIGKKNGIRVLVKFDPKTGERRINLHREAKKLKFFMRLKLT